MELGDYPVRELELQRSTHTLERWMAHHLAELMNESKSAATPKIRRQARDRAIQLIVKIWEQRRGLNANIDPLSTYKSVLPALNLLNADSMAWVSRDSSNEHKLAAKLFRQAQRIVLSTLGDVLPKRPKEPRPNVVTKFLREFENSLLDKFDAVAAATSSTDLSQEIDTTETILTELRQEMLKRPVTPVTNAKERKEARTPNAKKRPRSITASEDI